MSIKLRCKANKHQHDFYHDTKSILLHLSTGFGGGKTHILCYKLLQLSIINRRSHGGLVCQDYKEFKRDVLPEMEEILEKHNIKYKYHRTEYWFKFPWSNKKLFVVSAEKKIRGPNWGYAGINEVTLIPLIRYKEVIGRVRHKLAVLPQIVSVGTPEGFASEYYDYFIEKPPKNLRIIYGSTLANRKNLTEGYVDMLRDSYDSKMIETYLDGMWVNMTGNRFYYSHSEKNQDRRLTKDLFHSFHCSMDFNVDPFCATIWGYDGSKLYGVDQVQLEGGEGYKTTNMTDALKARGYRPENTIIYPDPAGQARSTKGESDVLTLQRAGYQVRVKKAAPNFRKRQLCVNNLLDKGRIVYNPDKCQGIHKDFLGVELDVILLEKVKKNPKLTHHSDGLDYMADILFPFSGDPKATTVEKLR